MPKFKLLLLVTLALFLFNLSASAQTKQKSISYFNGSVNDFRSALRVKHQPGLLYIYSETAGDWATFERKVMCDTGIMKFIDSSKIISYRLNALNDPQEVVSYGIDNLPALILFDKNGWERDRLTGYRSVKEVHTFLEQVFH